MRIPLAVAAVVVAAAIVGAAQAPAPAPAWLEVYREPASRLVGAALADTAAWNRLAELTDTFGHRLSGPRVSRTPSTGPSARCRETVLKTCAARR